MDESAIRSCSTCRAAVYPNASEVTTLWRYTNMFIIISSICMATLISFSFSHNPITLQDLQDMEIPCHFPAFYLFIYNQIVHSIQQSKSKKQKKTKYYIVAK